MVSQARLLFLHKMLPSPLQIQKLFTITDLTDKTLQVEMEKKAEKDRVEVLAHDVQLLESRLREALESVGNNRWQQLMDKVLC